MTTQSINTQLVGTGENKLTAWRLLVALVYLPWVMALGLPTALLAIAINRYKWHEYPWTKLIKLQKIQFAGVVLLATWLFSWGALSYTTTEPTIYRLVAILWVTLIPLAPLVAMGFRALDKLMRKLRPLITLEEQLNDYKKRMDKEDARLSAHASKIANAGADLEGQIHLGAYIKGDTFPARLGVYNRANHVYIEDRLIREHMLIIGTTGAGKTETLKNLIKEILRSSDRDIFIVDGKGDLDFASDIASLIHEARGTSTPIFKLGQTTTGAVYHGFRGEPTEIYNRLCALVGVDEATGDATYYADINRNLLQLICYAQDGAPTSFEEVRERLNRKWLLDAYKGTEEETYINTLEEKNLSGLLMRVLPLVREFAQIVDPQGFILEDSRGAIFSLRTQSVGDSARRFLKFLVEDFKDFVGKRQKRPAVFIIDEFGAFGNNNITALLSLARSSDLGVVLATQDAVTLGDEATKKKILANTRTKMLMVTEYPEDLAQLAGTIYAIEASVQHSEGDPTGVGSARIQHQFKIDMNEAAKLQSGEAFIIRQRTSLKLKGSMVGKINRNPKAIAQYTKPKRAYTPPKEEHTTHKKEENQAPSGLNV